MGTKQIDKAYVFRLYLTESQETFIFKAIGCARFVYNYFLARRRKYYEETGETLGYSKCNLELTLLKQDKDHLWLNEVDKFALQNSLRDLDTAFVNFFREQGKAIPSRAIRSFIRSMGRNSLIGPILPITISK